MDGGGRVEAALVRRWWAALGEGLTEGERGGEGVVGLVALCVASAEVELWELSKPLMKNVVGEGVGGVGGEMRQWLEEEGGVEGAGEGEVGWERMREEVERWERQLEGGSAMRDGGVGGGGMGREKELGRDAGQGVRRVSRCPQWTPCPLGRMPYESRPSFGGAELQAAEGDEGMVGQEGDKLKGGTDEDEGGADAMDTGEQVEAELSAGRVAPPTPRCAAR